MTKTEKEKQIKALENLGLTTDEIAEVLADDEKIEKGAKLFELPKELKKGAKKARNAGNCKGYTKRTEKEKKVDVIKRFLIQSMGEIAENLADNGTIEIANPEREFTFIYKGKKYKIVLSCPRK
jgi:hypothetical protein